ncbi:MAG: type VI secretion system tip protein VgrG [Deltaproteobacteria bacterium]|nr:type VI secretion system tip protein VgrG [Deltaproteobacteria bacterium]
MATGTLQTTFQVGDIVATRVNAFREERRLGRPPELWVTVQINDQIDGDALVGQPAAFVLGRRNRDTRGFFGLVEAITVVASPIAGGTGVDLYRFHLVTPLSLLDHVVTCEIFQEMDVKEIVSKVLDGYGITDHEWRLTGTYPKREYCVQYNESSLDFISRLLEEEGIYYFTEFSPDGTVIIFSDESKSADDLPGEDNRLPFRPDAAQDSQGDSVRSIDERHRVRSGKFVLRDYDFERPELDMTVEAESDIDTDLERYDYPGGYVEPSEGTRLAKIQLEAEQVERHLLMIEADSPRLVPGKKVVIEDAIHDEINGEYVTTSVTQELVSSRTAEQLKHLTGAEKTADRDEAFLTRATLVPADVPFRTRQNTPKPLIEGPQTATVVCPAGARPEEIHTDEWGRSKVRFHWDRANVFDDKASCWMRTKQLQTSGSMILPRLDWEVVVEFLEGDPDRPVVTGRMYNGLFMPPYALPEGKSRTALRTHTTPEGTGFNEIRLEDKAGGEEIFVHAQYDMNVVAANNKAKSIGNSEQKHVAVDSTMTVGSNQDIQVTMGGKGSIGADQSLTVGANRSVEVNALSALKVGGNSSNSVGGNHFEMDGDPLTALVNLAVEKATEVLQEKAGEMLEQVDAYVQDKVDQVMGPINNMQEQVGRVAEAMDSVSQGQLGEVSTALTEAASLPQVGELGGQMREAAFGGVQAAGDAAGVEVNAPGEDAEGFSAQTGLDQLTNGVIEQGVRAAGDVADQGLHDLFGEALGLDGPGGGGASLPNEVGPELDVAGVDETDREQGPGHSLNKVDGSLTESDGSLKVAVAIMGINTEVAGDMTQTIGIGRIEGAWGDRTETVDGNKDETAVGLIVLSKGDVSEKVSGSKTCMVGGAIVDLIAGGHTVEAEGPATMIAALHKVTAKEKITFKVGSSEVVVEGDGVTFSAPIIAVLSPKIQLTKKAAEN